MSLAGIYEELDMQRYATLIADMLPGRDFIITLYDDSEKIIWSSENEVGRIELASMCYKTRCENVLSDGCCCVEEVGSNGNAGHFNLGYLAGRSAGEIVFYDAKSAGHDDDLHDSVMPMLCNVAELIKTELGYLYEVNAMAVELGERYDELSMLRTSDIGRLEHSESCHIFSTYIKNCADHLRVDYAAIWIAAKQEIYPGGVAYNDESAETLLLLEKLSKAAFSMFENGCSGFGINDKGEPLRRKLDLPDNKKLLLVPVVDATGKPFGVLTCLNEFGSEDFSSSDQATLEAVSRKIYRYLLSTNDEVTGLLNKKGFEEAACRNLSRMENEQYLVLFNIEQFKVVNTVYGTATGDRVLASVAEMLSKSEYRLKYLARLDADVFAALIDGVDEEVERLIATICNKIDETKIFIDEKSLSVKTRAGVVNLNSKEKTIADYLYAAELALDSAKEDGRQLIIYKRGNTSLLKKRHQLTQVENIKNALKEDRFELYCQRIQPLSGNELHYEILVRMLGVSGEIIPPDDFIPVAERFNLMIQVDRWVIKNTFKLLCKNEYREISTNCKWGVNLSGMTISDNGFHDYVSDCLREYKFPPANLYFEITETAAIKNFHNCTIFMDKINSMGVQFALDDFGSGLSSFSYLKKLSIDYLKIDGSLVKDIVSSRLDQTMVSSIANIAKVLNVKTIAEYVENDLILEMLKNMNIDYAQGYGIMKPQPLEIELRNLLVYSEDRRLSNG